MGPTPVRPERPPAGQPASIPPVPSPRLPASRLIAFPSYTPSRLRASPPPAPTSSLSQVRAVPVGTRIATMLKTVEPPGLGPQGHATGAGRAATPSRKPAPCKVLEVGVGALRPGDAGGRSGALLGDPSARYEWRSKSFNGVDAPQAGL